MPFVEKISYSPGDKRYAEVGGLFVDRREIQRLAFGIMAEYGFNSSIFIPATVEKPSNFSNWSRYEGEISREDLVFPSQSIPGLSFRRERYFYSTANKTFSISWHVVGDIY